jgi:hypothetical protein
LKLLYHVCRLIHINISVGDQLTISHPKNHARIIPWKLQKSSPQKVEALLNKFDLDYDKKLPMSDEVKRTFISNGGQESDVAHYIEILSEIGNERQKLATVFDLELGKANIAR